MNKKMAIIDLGSNSVRMIIMMILEDGSYKMLDQIKEMVRLSEGMGKDNILKPLAIKRTIYTLKLFRKLIDVHDVKEIYGVATAAVRNAKNQKEFLNEVKIKTGFEFKVITGEEEGYYDYLGVINTIDIKNCVMIDTGGASTEIGIVFNRKLENVISLPYGAVVLTERFDNELKNNNHVEKFIKNKYKEIPWLIKGKKFPVVGLGGSIRTLAKVHKREIGFPLEGLHNYRMNFEDVKGIYKKIISTDVNERKNIPGISKSRGDIIGKGLAPIKVLMEFLGSKKLIISGNGLREGIFYKHYIKDNKENTLEVLNHSLENILKNYSVNIKHSYHVQKLSISLFEQLKSLHKMGENEKKILKVGALLHDIGMCVDYYNHHNHGFYLVLNSRIYGLTNRELVMCAFIVGMHRNTDLKKDWRNFKIIINKNDYEIIKKLSLLVKIAEKLDRSEYGNVEDIICNITKKNIVMTLKTNSTSELEIASIMKNEKDFEKIFDRTLIINKY
ncbi:Ppx/GppA phosphatase family protein [Defluviitalea phaphyphila]|uniref:Ppx/GppA phosphatase family protein n=1 Tax=Defluviitalea phaphyphila TaxID=1473580 RepID=UPI0007318C4B|nr:Ppx/GppA phosphatase family protein [Defluviitalea phaphyphila]